MCTEKLQINLLFKKIKICFKFATLSNFVDMGVVYQNSAQYIPNDNESQCSQFGHIAKTESGYFLKLTRTVALFLQFFFLICFKSSLYAEISNIIGSKCLNMEKYVYCIML